MAEYYSNLQIYQIFTDFDVRLAYKFINWATDHEPWHSSAAAKNLNPSHITWLPPPLHPRPKMRALRGPRGLGSWPLVVWRSSPLGKAAVFSGRLCAEILAPSVPSPILYIYRELSLVKPYIGGFESHGLVIKHPGSVLSRFLFLI